MHLTATTPASEWMRRSRAAACQPHCRAGAQCLQCVPSAEIPSSTFSGHHQCCRLRTWPGTSLQAPQNKRRKTMVWCISLSLKFTLRQKHKHKTNVQTQQKCIRGSKDQLQEARRNGCKTCTAGPVLCSAAVRVACVLHAMLPPASIKCTEILRSAPRICNHHSAHHALPTGASSDLRMP